MKRAFIAVFAALLAVAASAITATKEYVDRKDAAKRDKTDLTVYGLVTNSYRLAKDCLPVRGYIYQQDVRSELDITSWEMADWPDPEAPVKKILTAKKSDGSSYFALFVDENGLAIHEDGLMAHDMTYGGRKFTSGEWPILEPVTSISPTADQLAKKSEAFPAADGRQVAAQVAAQGAYINAEDARFVSTNYDSKVRLPEAYFEIKLPDGKWARMWSEMTRWNWFLEGIYSPWTNTVNAALSAKGEKEWGFFDAATGAPAPDGFLWASMPRIAICAGAAYQRIAEADGAYWVLESNGMVAEINGTTNGFFRIVDDEGKAQFEIVKGDKRTLFAAPGSMVSSVMGITHYHVTYSITNAVEAPVAEFSRSIAEPEWFDESDAACPANVSWTKKDASTYICEWWPKSAEPLMFMRAAFAVGGETRIRQTAPVEMQRLVIGGKTYTLTVSEINGEKVLTLDE